MSYQLGQAQGSLWGEKEDRRSSLTPKFMTSSHLF